MGTDLRQPFPHLWYRKYTFTPICKWGIQDKIVKKETLIWKPMRRTKDVAEQTRKAILNIAEELFLINGVSRTTLEMIARECGVTRGAVYWHFKEKAHLVREIFNSVRIPRDEATELLRANGTSDGLSTLYELCIKSLERFIQPGRQRRIMTILILRCELTHDLREFERCENALVREFIDLVQSPFDRERERLQRGVTR